MTGVRVRSAVDRSVLGLPSRLAEIATGFSDVSLIASTHARGTWRAGSPGHLRHPFQKDEAPQVVGEVRHADLARGGTMPTVQTISTQVLFFRSPNTCATRARLFARDALAAFRPLLRSRLRLAAQQMRRLRPRAAALFFDLIAAIGAVALRSPCL
jgi:hypothetical protein